MRLGRASLALNAAENQCFRSLLPVFALPMAQVIDNLPPATNNTRLFEPGWLRIYTDRPKI